MPYKYAKPGTQIYQIRLTLRDPLEKKIQLSFPLQSRTKASDTPTTRRSKLGVKNAEAERSIIGCETVKIRARTPFCFSDSKHRGISWRIILVNETAQTNQPSLTQIIDREHNASHREEKPRNGATLASGNTTTEESGRGAEWSYCLKSQFHKNENFNSSSRGGVNRKG